MAPNHICFECINKNQIKLWYICVFCSQFLLHTYVFQNQNWHDRFSAVLLVMLSGGNGRGLNIGRSKPSWHATNIIKKTIQYTIKILIVVTNCHFIEFCCWRGSLTIPYFCLISLFCHFLKKKIQMNLNWKSPQ